MKFRKKKKETNLNSNIFAMLRMERIVFFVYVAEYNKLSFTEGGSSKINKEIMERLFKTASGKYFLKDHDEISRVVTVNQLRDTPNRAEREMFIDAEVRQILSVRSSC